MATCSLRTYTKNAINISSVGCSNLKTTTKYKNIYFYCVLFCLLLQQHFNKNKTKNVFFQWLQKIYETFRRQFFLFLASHHQLAFTLVSNTWGSQRKNKVRGLKAVSLGSPQETFYLDISQRVPGDNRIHYKFQKTNRSSIRAPTPE